MEWTLKFVIEEEEAKLRFRHIFHTFQADPNVSAVEESVDSSEPEVHILIVRFADGMSCPANKRLQSFDRIYGDHPLSRKSRYQRLLGDFDLFDD